MADERRTRQVSLGCGTLILIALIVLIFSGRGTGKEDPRSNAGQNQAGAHNRAPAHQVRSLHDFPT